MTLGSTIVLPVLGTEMGEWDDSKKIWIASFPIHHLTTSDSFPDHQQFFVSRQFFLCGASHLSEDARRETLPKSEDLEA